MVKKEIQVGDTIEGERERERYEKGREGALGYLVFPL